jgi:outer membrane protein assembly factor BamB
LAGIVAAGILAARPREADALDRLVDHAPGTTWVYRSTTSGQPSGVIVQQVTGSALLLGGEATILQYSSYPSEDLRGPPSDVSYGYEGRQASSWVAFGTRRLAGFEQSTPPQPIFEQPLERGRTYSWSGKVGNDSARQTTRVVAIETVNVLGRRVEDCVHSRTESQREMPAGRLERADERWDCPGIGFVRGTTDQKIAARGFESRTSLELVEFHGRGLDLVASGGSLLPPGGDGGEAGPGETIGIDGTRARHVPGADLDLRNVSWSITRTAAVRFPPVGHRGLLVLAEEDGTVSATDQQTGRIAWSIRLGGPVLAPPVLAGDSVLVAAPDKTLLALDTATGAERWVARLPDVVSAAPLVVGRTVVVAVEDKTLRALRLSDGGTIWTAETAALVLASPALAGSAVVVGDTTGTLLAVSADDGRRVWLETLEGGLAGGPVAYRDLVLATDDGGTLYAYDSRSGELEWSARSKGAALSTPAVARDTVVAIAESPNRVEAYDAGSGARRWSTPYPGNVDVPPLVLGDTVVVLTRGGRLLTHALADGRRLAASEVPRPNPALRVSATTELAFVDGTLVAAARLGRPWELTSLVAFPANRDAPRGGVTFRGDARRLASGPSGIPVIVGEDVVVPSQDKRLWSVPPAGQPRQLLESDVPVFFALRAGELVLGQKAVPAGEEGARGGLTSLVALTPQGRPAWTATMGQPQVGVVPAVVGRTLAVPIHGLGLQGVDAATGRLLWLRPTTGGLGITSPLAIPGGGVVYGVKTLARYDARTGAVRWSRDNVNAFGPLAYGGGTVFGTVFFGQQQSVVLAADARTGETRWQAGLALDGVAGPVVAGGSVITVDNAGVVRAWDAKGGRERWTLQLRNRALATPVAIGDRVVAAEQGRTENVTEREYRVLVLDGETGRFLASLQPGGSAFTVRGALGASDGVLLVPTLQIGAPALLLVRVVP